MKKYFLLFSLAISIKLQPVILESEEDAERLCKDQTIGYYVGSFDPFHHGHMSVIEQALTNGCDKVLVFASFGGDERWGKNRTEITIRNEALFELFHEHPNVIITQISPIRLQEYLTKPNSPMFDSRTPNFNAKYICLIGSDAAMDLSLKTEKVSEYLKFFMQGKTLSSENRSNSLGGLFAIPVGSFLIFLRHPHTKDIIKHAFPNNQIGSKQIKNIIEPINTSTAQMSSREIKHIMKLGVAPEQTPGLLPQILSIINRYKLYRR